MFDHENNPLEFAFKVVGIQVLAWLMSVVAISLNVALSSVIAIPFWLFWQVFGIGSKYFGFLPNIYLDIHLWQCMGVFVCIGLVKLLITSSNAKTSIKE